VFIRSLSTRGALGGLSRSTFDAAMVLDAYGCDVVIIETVGAGQSEVDIARVAHTTAVVAVPGSGDDIQAIKAGILEIADILVINKADRPGVENTEKALRSMLELAHPTPRVYRHHGTLLAAPAPLHQTRGSDESWIPPIQKTISTDGQGIPEVAEQINRHAEYLRSTGGWAARDQARLASELDIILQQALVDQFHAREPETRYNEILEKVFQRSLSPWEAVAMLTDPDSADPKDAAGKDGSHPGRKK